MTEYRIITVHERPPIPYRSMDWAAFYEGCEEDGPMGWGATEEEAIQDLLLNYDLVPRASMTPAVTQPNEAPRSGLRVIDIPQFLNSTSK